MSPARHCMALGCGLGRRATQPFCAPHYALLDAGTKAQMRQAGRSGDKAAGRAAIRVAVRELADQERR